MTSRARANSAPARANGSVGLLDGPGHLVPRGLAVAGAEQQGAELDPPLDEGGAAGRRGADGEPGRVQCRVHRTARDRPAARDVQRRGDRLVGVDAAVRQVPGPLLLAVGDRGEPGVQVDARGRAELVIGGRGVDRVVEDDLAVPHA